MPLKLRLARRLVTSPIAGDNRSPQAGLSLFDSHLLGGLIEELDHNMNYPGLRL